MSQTTTLGQAQKDEMESIQKVFGEQKKVEVTKNKIVETDDGLFNKITTYNCEHANGDCYAVAVLNYKYLDTINKDTGEKDVQPIRWSVFSDNLEILEDNSHTITVLESNVASNIIYSRTTLEEIDGKLLTIASGTFDFNNPQQLFSGKILNTEELPLNK